MAKKVKVYALSTCGWCRKTTEWLKQHDIKAEVIYTDKIEDPAEKEKVTAEARAKAGKLTFPTVVICDASDECVITGYDPAAMEEKLLK